MLETENEEKRMCTQLGKAAEIILICPLINPHCQNYCFQQVSLVETKYILYLSIYAFANFHVCNVVQLLFLENIILNKTKHMYKIDIQLKIF